MFKSSYWFVSKSKSIGLSLKSSYDLVQKTNYWVGSKSLILSEIQAMALH